MGATANGLTPSVDEEVDTVTDPTEDRPSPLARQRRHWLTQWGCVNAGGDGEVRMSEAAFTRLVIACVVLLTVTLTGTCALVLFPHPLPLMGLTSLTSIRRATAVTAVVTRSSPAVLPPPSCPTSPSFPSVDWRDASLCDPSQWSSLVSAVLATAPKFDDSVGLSGSDGEGSRRLLLVFLKLLCRQSVSLGILGTSVSTNDGDKAFHYGRLVHRWMAGLPTWVRSNGSRLLPSVGFKNAATSGTGSDFAALCLDSLFHRSAWSTVPTWAEIPVEEDNTPPLSSPAASSPSSPLHLTAAQLAASMNASARLPDLLFVEFNANDFAAVTDHGVWEEDDWGPNSPQAREEPSAALNMRTLLSQVMRYSATAPLLIITPISKRLLPEEPIDDLFSSLEPVYELATTPRGVPLLSVRAHLGLSVDRITSSLNGSSEPYAGDLAIAKQWKRRWFVDHAHLTEEGNREVGVMITAYFTRMLTHLSRTIQTQQRLQQMESGPSPAASSPECQHPPLPSAEVLPADNGQSVSRVTGVCSIKWKGGQLNVHLVNDSSVVEKRDWVYWYQGSGDKFGWTSSVVGAVLVFDLSSFKPGSTPVSCSIAYLRTWDSTIGKVLAWVSAVRADGTRVNVSEAREVNGWWRLPQSTLVVSQSSFTAEALSSPHSAYQLHVYMMEDGKRFGLAGINVDFSDG